MALFEVPGWKVPNAPVTSSAPKKRKRPASASVEDGQMQAAAVNVEKLMRSIDSALEKEARAAKKQSKAKETPTDTSALKSPTRQGKEKAKKKRNDAGGSKAKADAPAEPAHRQATPDLMPDGAQPLSKKRKQDKHKGKSQDAPSASAAKPPAKLSAKPAAKPSSPAGPSGPTKMTAMQTKMKSKLDGARFRWINEEFYKSDSAHARELIRGDPSMFEEYHKGFRHQVQSWPTNPVSQYIDQLSGYSAKTVVVDLGCGDAALAKALLPKGLVVLSYDLVSDGAFVVEADSCGTIPLPGSEGNDEETTNGDAHVVDVAVCSLSLMGTNWPNTIREAWRILKPNGELKIAEVASRFTDVNDFVSLVTQFGFQLKSKDTSNTHFTTFEFKKKARKPRSRQTLAKLTGKSDLLKPCEYKRR